MAPPIKKRGCWLARGESVEKNAPADFTDFRQIYANNVNLS